MTKRPITNAIDRRCFPVELRAGDDGEGGRTLKGYAAVFERTTVLVKAGAWFKGSPEIREVIEAGAFRKSLGEGDQRAVWNHNTDIVLGRKSNDTLKLREDAKGLATEIIPPETDLVRDMVIAPIERGDVDQMSFGFRIVKEQRTEEDNVITYRLKELDLVEVSPVAIPAYSDTEIALSARSAERIDEIRQQRQAAFQPEPGNHSEDADVLPKPVPDHSVSASHLKREREMLLEIRERMFPNAA